MIMMDNMPCQQDCKNRSATCKFDGTCELYRKWQEHRTEILTAYYDNKRLAKTAEHYSLDKTMKHFKKKVRANKVK